MPANPLITNFQTWIKQLIGRSNSRPSPMGFLGYDGQVKAVPGDYVPLFGAIATASDDGFSGVKPATENGDLVRILADKYGILWTRILPDSTLDSYSTTTNPAGEASHSVAGAQTFVEAVAYNGTGAKAYLMIFDLATLPANGAVPAIAPIAVNNDATVAVDADAGLAFANGITVGLSSTPFTLTTVGPASFTVVYR